MLNKYTHDTLKPHWRFTTRCFNRNLERNSTTKNSQNRKFYPKVLLIFQLIFSLDKIFAGQNFRQFCLTFCCPMSWLGKRFKFKHVPLWTWIDKTTHSFYIFLIFFIITALGCSTEIDIGNSQNGFDDVILNYTVDQTSELWVNAYAPGCTGNSVCSEYKDIPSQVDCDALPVDNDYRRLCHCISPGENDDFRFVNRFFLSFLLLFDKKWLFFCYQKTFFSLPL